MHGAPAVSYPVGRCLWHLRVIIFVWLLGLAALFGLLQSQSRVEWALWPLVCVSLAGVPALVVWKNTVPGILQWDGQCWHWSGSLEPSPCDVDVLIDLQNLMLIRVRPACSQCTWHWLNSQAATTQWIALRRALVAGVELRGKGQKNQTQEALPEP